MQKNIIHMLFTGRNASPFDVNMAVDAGYDIALPYTGITREDIIPLVQDAIYSRPPKSFKQTGIFIGGYDVNEATDMLDATRGAMVKPFEVSVMADPNGAFTTSAAMIALVQHHLHQASRKLAGCRAVIFGGGPVGISAAVLLAQHGAIPVIARLTPESVEKKSAMDRFLAHHQVSAEFCAAETPETKLQALEGADIILSAAKAGVEILSDELMQKGCNALVAADVNAVPPAGIAGIGVMDNGVILNTKSECRGIGALAIGNFKYKAQQGLFKKMLQSDEAVVLSFQDAFDHAVELVAS